MFVVGTIQMIFEIAVFALPSFRSFVISRQTGAFPSGEMKRFIEKKCNIGDWFILHQIGKNTNKDFFHDLLEDLSLGKLRKMEAGNSDREGLLLENNHENVTAIPMDQLQGGEKV